LETQKAILALKIALEEKEKEKMQGFERMRMFQQQCKLLQQRLCGGANPRIRDKYGVVMFDFSQTLVPMGIQTVGQVDLVLDRIEVMQQDLPAKIEKVDNDLRDASSIFKGMVELDDVDSDAKSNEHGAQNPQHIHTYIHTHIHTYIHTYTLHTHQQQFHLFGNLCFK